MLLHLLCCRWVACVLLYTSLQTSMFHMVPKSSDFRVLVAGTCVIVGHFSLRDFKKVNPIKDSWHLWRCQWSNATSAASWFEFSVQKMYVYIHQKPSLTCQIQKMRLHHVKQSEVVLAMYCSTFENHEFWFASHQRLSLNQLSCMFATGTALGADQTEEEALFDFAPTEEEYKSWSDLPNSEQEQVWFTSR